MSTYDEQKFALIRTKEFLFALLDPKQTPKVPREVRKQASQCLRHYPIVLDAFLADGQTDDEVAKYIYSDEE
jgi:hypothetical protein